MSALRWTRARRSRLLLVLLAVAATVSTAGASGQSKVPRISIKLLAPASNSMSARYGASPAFSWQIASSTESPLHGSGRLEVSTTASFAQSATWRFDCGYSPGDCVLHHQWAATPPYWYDQANSCDDVPPVGNCGSLSKMLYWRVRYQPVGGKSWSSAVGTVRRSISADTAPPKVKAVDGSAPYGQSARVLFYVSDNSGTTRDIVQIYDGGKVVFGMRTEWDEVDTGSFSYRYLDLPLPASIDPGTYRWCLTAQDQSDNKATDCASYTIADADG